MASLPTRTDFYMTPRVAAICAALTCLVIGLMGYHVGFLLMFPALFAGWALAETWGLRRLTADEEHTRVPDPPRATAALVGADDAVEQVKARRAATRPPNRLG